MSALAQQERNNALKLEQLARSEALITRQNLYASDIYLAHQAGRRQPRPRPARAGAVPFGPIPPHAHPRLVRGFGDCVGPLPGRSNRWVWNAHAGAASCLAFSPDGTTLASGGADKMSGFGMFSRNNCAPLCVSE